jgi:sirohydrochlorin ferrochelatase
MGRQRRRESASATATRSVPATKVRVLFTSRAAHWLRRLPAHVTAIAHAKPNAEHAIITYAAARAIRRTVLARLTTCEHALLGRWCIGITVVYAGLAAFLAILLS